MDFSDDDEGAIRALIERWVIWRDSGDWERFRGLWHPDGLMCATWFRGPAMEFIERSRRAFDNGVDVMHQLGGTTVDVQGDRAVAQTKMCILQRAELVGVEVDVACHGRFYDLLVDDGGWRLARRQPIYERDRLDPVLPGATVEIDLEVAARFPRGYRFLGYLQTTQGFQVRTDLPGRTGPAVERLYEQGRKWLSGVEPIELRD